MSDEQLPKRRIGEASAEAATKHPHLEEQFFDRPVRRFIRPPAYEGLKVAEAPSAVDALTQPGVIQALRDILEDLEKPPVAEPEASADE